MTITQQSNDVLARAIQSVVGGLVNSNRLTKTTTALNGDPQAVQVEQITVTAANATLYTMTVNLISVTFLSDATATTQEIRDGLIAAVNEEPGIRGSVLATIADTNQLDLTGKTPGVVFTLTVGALLAIANQQSAALSDPVPFGRLVLDDGISDSVDQLGRIAKSTAFVSQRTRVGILFVASATYLVAIRDEAGAVLAEVEVDATINTIATSNAIAVALNSLLPANSVLVILAADHFLCQAELTGREFTVSIGTNEAGEVGGAITGAAFTQRGPDVSTSVNRAALGLSMFSSNDPTPEIGGEDGEYAANAGMRLLQSGNSMWVESPGVVTFGDPVFVELAAGADEGKLFTADSATRCRLLGATWVRDGRTADLAAVSALF